MALHNLYTNLKEANDISAATATSTSVTFPYHNNSLFKYGAGSPIFDGVFESNTLDFGKGSANDRQGDGNFSNQPFIKRTINYDNSIDSFTDGLVRGGILTATERSLKDVERITKFLLTPQGLGFLTKQVGLQKSNPVIFDDNNDQRTYNLGLNTLASVASSATGIRFKREGRIPFSDPTAFSGYDTGIGIRKEGDDNRLIQLFKGHISLEETPDNQFKLLEYRGGPKSLYGIGQTTINKYTHYNNQDNYILKNGEELIPTLSSEGKTIESVPFNLKPAFKDSEGNIIDIGGKYGNGFSITNFRSLDDDITQNTPSFKTRESIGEKKQGIGLQSPLEFRSKSESKLLHKPSITSKQKSKYNDESISTYHVSYDGKSDAVNLKDIQTDLSAYTGNDDFIPFRFEAVNTTNPLKSDYIIFRAFLDGFNDNYNANHNSFNYNGRGETFYTYNGFTRNIDFQFKIAAQSKEEILPLYTKLNYLVSNVAPEYGLAINGGRMRTPFIKLTVGDWCNRVPGVLNTIALSWQKDYPWQIKNSENTLMLPHVLDVNVQFTPIHNFLPEKSIDSQFFNLKGANA